MVLYSGCVADDAEAEKRNIVQIASLRNGGRLHINGKTVGETLLDGIQLRTVGDELVAGTDKSAVDAAFHSGFVQRQGMFQQRGTSLVRGGKTLHLSVLVTVAAPDVVIHQTLACHYIRHLQASINAARHTGADDAVRRKAPYQFRSSYRCTHLTDAALRQDYMVTAQCTFHIAETTIARRILILQALHQPAVFAVHCTDYPYCHIYNNLSLHIIVKAL